jgi:23S rRNA pseudouridine1911/1915/1917 synthase
VEISLDILFEDSDLVVVNKPPDLVVHPAAGNEERTLVNAMLHHCKGQLSGIGGVERPGIVHRLDKVTTGCIIVAKNDEAHLGLSKQFADRTVEKTYLAIVHGQLPEPAGDIKAAIARHPNHRKVMAVTEQGRGKEAWTSYRIMERLRGATLVEVTLHTGRTHQIRVHFKHIGHPLVGDTTYGKRQIANLQMETDFNAPRVMLHSFRLSFVHPRTGRRHLLQAPIPADFREAMQSLKRP